MKTLTVNQEGIEKLSDCFMYRLFVVYGRDVSFEKVQEIYQEHGMNLPQDLIRGSFEFTQDQYDYNEADGWNDQEYPNRKKSRNRTP